jgi:hypothetical protein
MRRIVVLVCFTFMCFLPAAIAQNLLTNNTFPSSTTGWTFAGAAGSLTFDPTRDADGSPSSGSAAVANTQTGIASASVWMSQCVGGITAGTQYYWGGKVMLRLGETTTGNTHMPVLFYDGAGCTGTNVGGTTTNIVNPATDPRGTWLTVSQGTIAGGFAAPVGAVSALVRPYITKADTIGTYTANFDNLYLAAVGTTPVELVQLGVE